ncbi:MAG: S8 family serine peptidase, partial [Dehalococcoidia bacterium]
MLVAFNDGVAVPLAPAVAARWGLETLEFYPLTGIHRVRVRSGDVDAAARRLSSSELVRFAEPNYLFRVAALVPDDTRYAEQAGYWDLLGGPDAWEISTGDRSVVVALLDGAVDLDHPDLAANIWTNEDEIPGNGVDDDGNGFIDDVHGYDFVGANPGGSVPLGEDNDPDAKPGDPATGDGLDQDGDGEPDGAVGHGTRVAGILAATGNNGIGVAGTAWQVSIMPLRVTDPEGEGFFSSFVRALEYAVTNGADVVNISLASSVLPQTAAAAVEAALDAGLILVAAAGNGGLNVSFPAALPGVIAVGSHGPVEDPASRALFSPRNVGVDIVAPGIDVLSTDVLPITGEPAYATSTGTSFSAPFVSGAI